MRSAVHIKNVAANVFRDVDEKHIMAFAAGLSYYFVLSVFPLLIFVSAVVAYLPVSSLFNQIVGVLATVVPPDSMAMVKNILAHVLLSRHSGLLTFGIVFTIWSASSGFAAMIEALNVSYNVPGLRTGKRSESKAAVADRSPLARTVWRNHKNRRGL